MPVPDFDAVFFVDKVPVIEVRDGMFHVCFEVGRGRFEVVLLPNKFLAGLRRAQQVAAKFRSGSADILGFPEGGAKEA